MQLKNFFTKYLFISISLILFGILISMIPSSNKTVSFIIEVIAKIIESIGVAIFIGHIFTFTMGTEEFLNYIRNRLIKIVISKEFITKLSQSEQKNLLRMVLKPTKELSNMYSGINSYFTQYIDESINLFKKSYRGHMNIDAVASYNKEKNKIQILFDLDVITYKTDDMFEPIQLSLEEESFELLGVTIKGKGGEFEEINKEIIENILKPNQSGMKKRHEIIIPDKFNSLTQINTSIKIVEYGEKEWQIFSFSNAKPCDQLSITLRCEDNIIIKSSNMYGVEQKFSVEKSDKKIKVTYNDWLSPGFGVNIMVAQNNQE